MDDDVTWLPSGVVAFKLFMVGSESRLPKLGRGLNEGKLLNTVAMSAISVLGAGSDLTGFGVV